MADQTVLSTPCFPQGVLLLRAPISPGCLIVLVVPPSGGRGASAARPKQAASRMNVVRRPRTQSVGTNRRVNQTSSYSGCGFWSSSLIGWLASLRMKVLGSMPMLRYSVAWIS